MIAVHFFELIKLTSPLSFIFKCSEHIISMQDAYPKLHTYFIIITLNMTQFVTEAFV